MTSDRTTSQVHFRQCSPGDLPNENWDVVIIGAGPAGSTAATLLARLGHRVLLVDKSHFPREKVCGDILLPDTMRSLRRLGLEETIASRAFALGRLRGVSTGGTEFLIEGNYYSLKREKFDLCLVQESARSGAVCCCGEVVSLNDNASEDVIATFRSGETARARLAVIATGADGTLAKQSGIAVDSKVNAVALRAYVQSSHVIPEGILCYHKEIAPGYAWIFPLGEGLYNVGCGVTLSDTKHYNLKKMYQTFLAEYQPARDLLAQGRQMTHLGGGAIRFGLIDLAQAVKGRILAVGETIGTTLPFTGEGIGTAMQSAEMAVETVHEALQSGDPALLNSYPDRLMEFKPLFRGYDAAQRWLRFPLFNDLAARRIRSSKYLKELCSGVVAGQTDPREIYSLKGILKSFWK